MRRLLSYQWQHPNCSLSGPGWDWDDRLEVFQDDDELRTQIRELRARVEEERVAWEKKDPKWRDATFIPPFRRIRVFDLSVCDDPSLLEIP